LYYWLIQEYIDYIWRIPWLAIRVMNWLIYSIIQDFLIVYLIHWPLFSIYSQHNIFPWFASELPENNYLKHKGLV
jgi:hypothetical protein